LPSSSHGGDWPTEKNWSSPQQQQQQQQKRVGPGSIVYVRTHIYITTAQQIELSLIFLIGVRRRENRDGHDFDHVRHYMERKKNSLFPRHLFVRIRRETQHGQIITAGYYII
jgi:hypothetical protein